MQQPQPYTPPPVPPHRPHSIVGPVILIILGLAFLAQNLNLLDVNIWSLLWRLWPLWLIAAGLDLMLGRRTSWGSWIVLGIVIAIVGSVVAFGSAFTTTGALGEPVAIHQPLGGARQADVLIDASLARLSITSGASDNLVEGTATPLEFQRIQQDAHNSGDTLVFSLKSRSNRWFFGLPGNLGTVAPTWDLRLSEKVPMNLRIDTGVGDSRIDLSRLQLTRLEVDTGVGDTEITLPAQGRFPVTVDSGVGQVTIRIPKGMAARISADQGIGRVGVHGDFRREGTLWVSPNFSEAQNRVEIDIDGGVGEINIEQL
jgi:hypothetical protein